VLRVAFHWTYGKLAGPLLLYNAAVFLESHFVYRDHNVADVCFPQPHLIFSHQRKSDNQPAMSDGFFVIEARKMPFADESLPPAESADAFKARQCDAIEAMVRLNPVLVTDDDRLVHEVAGVIFSEMAELEGLYFQTIHRMAEARKESFFADDDVGEEGEDEAIADRPPIAMKFDGSTGRLVGMGVFPQLPHGFHAPKCR
jgi:hypothetical protein